MLLVMLGKGSKFVTEGRTAEMVYRFQQKTGWTERDREAGKCSLEKIMKIHWQQASTRHRLQYGQCLDRNGRYDLAIKGCTQASRTTCDLGKKNLKEGFCHPAAPIWRVECKQSTLENRQFMNINLIIFSTYFFFYYLLLPRVLINICGQIGYVIKLAQLLPRRDWSFMIYLHCHGFWCLLGSYFLVVALPKPP